MSSSSNPGESPLSVMGVSTRNLTETLCNRHNDCRLQQKPVCTGGDGNILSSFHSWVCLKKALVNSRVLKLMQEKPSFVGLTMLMKQVVTIMRGAHLTVSMLSWYMGISKNEAMNEIIRLCVRLKFL